MSERWLILIAWIVVFVAALALRVSELSERPMHADEATGARILATRLEGGGFTFNPQHFHGPTLCLLSEPVARIRGETQWQELTASTLRIGPVVAGMLMVLTPLLWRRRIGSVASLVAGAFMATSPLLVYYNRMYIHESWLALFGMLACAALYAFLEKPRTSNALAAGVSLGLMFATKETFAISVISWSLGFAGVLFVAKRSIVGGIGFYVRPLIILLVSALVVSSLLYTDGFRNMQGIIDAVRSYFVYETVSGHEKPFGYYLHLLLMPKHALGAWWSEAVVGLLGLTSIFAAIRFKRHIGLVVFLSVAFCCHLLIYSIISYKTPWLMLLPWAHACLLAGLFYNNFSERSQSTRMALAVVLFLCLSIQAWQAVRASGSLSNDSRNPYAYVPTSKDAVRTGEWLLELNAMYDHGLSPIAVVGKHYWPLPWYLREMSYVGYWEAPEESLEGYSVVFAMPDKIDVCDGLLRETHTRLPRALRADYPLILYLENSIWDRWMEAEAE